jgi:hypothetical protein
MTFSKLIRQTHRWLGIALIGVTILNVIAFTMGHAIEWLYYLPLLPLFLSMISGLYMFVQPYLARRGSRAGGEA